MRARFHRNLHGGKFVLIALLSGCTDVNKPPPSETGGAPGGATSSTGGQAAVGMGGNAGAGAGGQADAGAASAGSPSVAGSAGAAGGAAPGDAVTLTDGSFDWKVVQFTPQSDGTLYPDGVNYGATETWSFPTKVLENDTLKVTLLPDYGGRILSIVYKPTNHELLYQNPLGTPYRVGNGDFYYNYLMILGGIFPTFPEPEHGKYWNQPFQFEVVQDDPSAMVVTMSRKDDRYANAPGQFSVGVTDVLLSMKVTLRAGHSDIEVETTLTNTRSQSVWLECWTDASLAPGSAPGQSGAARNTRIVVPTPTMHLRTDVWSWLATVEQPADGGLYHWDKLSYFDNWQAEGIAYVQPELLQDFWGAIDDDDEIGLLRVADRTGTPGLKLWTFGRDSVDVNVDETADYRRPVIEMWAGVSDEFFQRFELLPNEVRTLEESYFPTVGLREISAASKLGALELDVQTAGSSIELGAKAFVTVPGQTLEAKLSVGDQLLVEQPVTPVPGQPLELQASIDADTAAALGGNYRAQLLLDGDVVLEGSRTIP